MYKKLLSFCFVIIFLLMFEGCKNIDTSSNSASSKTQKEYVIEEAQKYLENKYPDDIFTYVSNTANVMGIRYYEMNFMSEKFGEERFKVYADPKVDDELHDHILSHFENDKKDLTFNYYDTYFDFLIRKDAESFFEEKTTRYLGNNISFKLNFNLSLYTAKRMNNKSDFKSYLDANCDIYLLCYGESKYSSIDNDLSELTGEFRNCGLYMMFNYVCIKPEYIDQINKQSYDNIFTNCYEMFYERKEYHINGYNDIYECNLIEYNL